MKDFSAKKAVLGGIAALAALMTLLGLLFPLVKESGSFFGFEVTYSENGFKLLDFDSSLIKKSYQWGAVTIGLLGYLQLIGSLVLLILSVAGIFCFSHKTSRTVSMVSALIFSPLFNLLYMIEGIVFMVLCGGAEDGYTTLAYLPFIFSVLITTAYIVCHFMMKEPKTAMDGAQREFYGDLSQAVFRELRGAQKILTVYEDRIALTQMKNARAFLSQNWTKGTKEIYFSNMTSVQYREPTAWLLGYIQFEVYGAGSANNFNSENSWTFESDMAEQAHRVVEYVRNKLSELKNNDGNSAPLSTADELLKFKNLLDAGVITPEEFERKKNELLGK